MEPISRRNALRLVVGTSAVAGGATLLPDHGLIDPASAATSKKITAELVRHTFRPGQRIVLEVWRHGLEPGSRIRVRDTNGLRWTRVVGSRHPRRWTATAGHRGGTINVRVVGPSGDAIFDPRYHEQLDYRVSGVMSGPLVGMNAKPDQWAQRISQVGPGVAARRIFADLAAGPRSQLKLVEAAHADGMLPVISYKVGGDVAGAVRGDYNAAAQQAAALLDSYDLPTAVTFWHEPYGDMSGAEYAAATRQVLPYFKRGKLRVGPILNGWLLDRQQSTFASFCADDLFRLWDWVGIDTYESGSVKPATRIPALSKFLASRGHGDLPLGVGEYNGYSAASIAGVGEALLDTPNVWFGCVFNNNGGLGTVLTGDRLTAYRNTLADPRSKGPR
jgi:hypothetical protein